MSRAFDIVVATVVLVVTSPLLLLSAIAIRLSGPGPVIYRQHRIGKDG